MRLTRLVVEGFRSIRERVEVPVDPHVTVILGANDHGKSNLLEALEYLDESKVFAQDDLNWDRFSEGSLLPLLEFHFALEPAEKAMLARIESARRLQAALAPMMAERNGQVAALSSEAASAKRAAAAAVSARNRLESRIKEVETQLDVARRGEREDPEIEAVAQFTEARLKAEESLRSLRTEFDEGVENLRVLEITEAEAAQRHEAAVSELDALRSLSARARLLIAGVPDLAGAQEAARTARSAAEVARAESDVRAAEAKAADEALQIARPRTQARRNALTVREETARAAGQAARRRSALEGRARLAEETAKLIAEVGAVGLAPSADAPRVDYEALEPDDCPSVLVFRRSGLEGRLIPEIPDRIAGETAEQFIQQYVPHIEAIPAVSRLENTVSVEDIYEPEQTFMRGLFYYAGIDPADWSGLFEQDNRTLRALRDASARLTSTLQASWSQGRDLKFVLTHSSNRENALELTIEDPSVHNMDVRASKRSAGFTHFFWLKTVLHAREVEHPAASCSDRLRWLLDFVEKHLGLPQQVIDAPVALADS